MVLKDAVLLEIQKYIATSKFQPIFPFCFHHIKTHSSIIGIKPYLWSIEHISPHTKCAYLTVLTTCKVAQNWNWHLSTCALNPRSKVLWHVSAQHSEWLTFPSTTVNLTRFKHWKLNIGLIRLEALVRSISVTTFSFQFTKLRLFSREAGVVCSVFTILSSATLGSGFPCPSHKVVRSLHFELRVQ